MSKKMNSEYWKWLLYVAAAEKDESKAQELRLLLEDHLPEMNDAVHVKASDIKWLIVRREMERYIRNLQQEKFAYKRVMGDVLFFYWLGLMKLTQGIASLYKKRDKHLVSRPPGFLLNRFAEFFCSPKTLNLVVNPILSDMQVEFCEALAAGRKVKATWVRVRGYWTFFKALGLYCVIKTVSEIWRVVISG